MKIGNISEKKFRRCVKHAVKESSKEMKKNFTPRKPYNPHSLYKRACKIEIVWIRIKSLIRRIM